MIAWPLEPPKESDYPPYYATYVSKVPSGNVIDLLNAEMDETVSLLRGIPEGRAGYRYAEGKWSIKEMVGHVLDTERVFAMRCIAFARADPNPWPGMDQDPWVAVAKFDTRLLEDLTGQLQDLRRANISMFRGMTDEDMARKGVASGVEFTAHSFPYIMAGHEVHHKKVLREKYL